MKELEALEKIKYYEPVVCHYENYKDAPMDDEQKETYELLRKALTPPTKEEVCKALSEYLDREVKINNDKSFYYTEEKQYYGECDEIICGFSWNDDIRTISFEFDLPPNLITLTGKFYEGLNND